MKSKKYVQLRIGRRLDANAWDSLAGWMMAEMWLKLADLLTPIISKETIHQNHSILCDEEP